MLLITTPSETIQSSPKEIQTSIRGLWRQAMKYKGGIEMTEQII